MPSSTFSNTDDFSSGLQSFFDVLAKHSKKLVAFGVLVALLGTVMAVIATRKQEKSDAGRNALYQANQNLDTELKAIAAAQAPAPAPVTDTKTKAAPKPAEPSPDAVMFSKLDVDTQLSGAVAKLKAVSDEYSDTRPGLEAMLALGKLYLNHGEPAKAEGWFRQAATHASTGLDQAVAWSSVADSLENQGKADDALKAVDQAIGVGDSSIGADLLLDKARIYETLKNMAQAKAIYQQVQTQFPNSEYAKIASLYISQLN